MVPFLYFFLGHPELSGAQVPAAQQAVVAHATSLLVIVPVSLRGAWLYHRAGLVEWRAVWRMGLASVVTASLGARAAVAMPAPLLKMAFGIFLLVIAIRLFIGRRQTEAPVDGAESQMHTGRALAGGAAVGFFSALLGVGGGLVAIPVLIYGLHVPIRKVTGTSLALITFTALVGVAAYAASGWAIPDGAGMLTYFQLPAALALAVGALLAVPLGTGLQMRMPTHALRKMFAVVFFLLGTRIIVVNLLSLLGS
jgi:uncharacterized membrane protein YfcA